MIEPVKGTLKITYFNLSFSTGIFSATLLTDELFSVSFNIVTDLWI